MYQEYTDSKAMVAQVVDNLHDHREIATYCATRQGDGSTKTDIEYIVTNTYEDKGEWGNLIPSKSEVYIGDKLVAHVSTTAYDISNGVRTVQVLDSINTKNHISMHLNTFDRVPVCGYQYVKGLATK